ncbi:hypothetical protein VTN00DRAFT_72 [Thermoascus crustaceus]|uniref:uncharacterized protein n=1 Tax=Thermoascus crustaceus TaxID=5088 RepID=UPI00374264E5
MPICIECSYPVSHLYTSYSKADDHSLGKGVRLTQCPRCKRFADKYVEHDFVVLFIDLVLIKPQVYRHLLFNRLGRDDNKFDRSIVRLGILLLLFDVYLTWARIERSSSLSSTPLSTAPIVVQYLFFLTLNAAATLVHHLTVRFLASMMVPKPPPSPVPNGDANSSLHQGTTSPANPSAPASSTDSTPAQVTTTNSPPSNSGNVVRSPSSQDTSGNGASARQPAPVPGGGVPAPLRRVSTTPSQTIQPLPPPSPASPSAISTALLVSSCPKLFPILLVIWGPEGSSDVPDTGSNETNSPAAAMLLQKTVEVLSSTATLSPTSAATAAATSACSLPPCPSPSTATSALTPFSPFSSASTSTLTSSAGWNPLNSIFQSLLSLLSLNAADTHLVLLNNIEALYILLDCGYMRAMALAVAGQAARWAVEKIILGVVGVG